MAAKANSFQCKKEGGTQSGKGCTHPTDLIHTKNTRAYNDTQETRKTPPPHPGRDWMGCSCFVYTIYQPLLGCSALVSIGHTYANAGSDQLRVEFDSSFHILGNHRNLCSSMRNALLLDDGIQLVVRESWYLRSSMCFGWSSLEGLIGGLYVPLTSQNAKTVIQPEKVPGCPPPLLSA